MIDFEILLLSLVAALVAAASFVVALQSYRFAKSPVVAVYLEPGENSRVAVLVAKNFGSGIAYDIEFSGYESLPVFEPLKEYVYSGFLKNGIPMLVPNAKRDTIVHVTEFAEDLFEDETTYEVEVRYYRSNKNWRRLMRQTFILEYYSFANTINANNIRGSNS